MNLGWRVWMIVAEPVLTPAQQVQVCDRLEAGPTLADEVCSLRGVDVQRILAEEFGVLRSLAAVYHLLHQLGYSYLTPRPRHRRSNPAAQEHYKRELAADEHAALIWDGAGFHTSGELNVPANVLRSFNCRRTAPNSTPSKISGTI